MKWGILFALVFLAGHGLASEVVCTIVEDRVLVEVFLDDREKVNLPGEYSLLEEDEKKVSFISKDFLKRDGEWIFVLPRIVDSDYSLEVYLPEGFLLVDDLIYPKGYDIESDGRSIILKWNDVDEEVIVFYEGIGDSFFWIWLLVVSLIILVVVVWNFQKRRFFRELKKLKAETGAKNKVARKKNVSRNLLGDEKKIVEFLIGRKSCWTKDLVRELGISKVRVSRKIRSLIEKGLLVRENFGRENKISLKKV